MSKGIGPIIVAIIIGGLALYSILLAVLIGRTEINVRALVEKEILSAINKMEFIKKEIPLTMQYSFYQALFDLGKRGGYENFATSYNCIAYWKVFSQDNTPDYKSNVEKTFLKVFSAYTSALSDSTLTFPNFQANVDNDSGTIKIYSDDSLIISNPNLYTLKENSSFTTNFDPKIVAIYDAGKDFATQASDEISTSSSYSDAVSRVSNLQSDFNNKYVGQYIFTAQSENNLGSGASSFVFRTLVTISDISGKKYPAYDFSENKTDYRTFSLSFYLFGGSDTSVQPATNSCEPINY